MIAKDLGISPATVTYHVRAAKRAHNCPTRQALMTKLRAATTAAQRQPRSA
jgi:FixJ family two-component response regulator